MSKKSTLEERFAKALTKNKVKYQREVKIVPGRKFSWDFLIILSPRKKILAEVNGGIFMRGRSGHSSGTGIARDAHKQLLAIQHGYTPITVTTDKDTSPEIIAEWLGGKTTSKK